MAVKASHIIVRIFTDFVSLVRDEDAKFKIVEIVLHESITITNFKFKTVSIQIFHPFIFGIGIKT